MEKKGNNTLKLIVGLLISVLFLYLAFGSIDFSQMKEAFLEANYWLLAPAILAQLFSHWFRSLRWRYFLKPVKRVRVSSLFSATMIGYMMNTILPAHLGEFFRAAVIGKREKVAGSSVFATIVVERIVDILSLLVIMVAALLIYPFPDFVTISGYIMFLLTIVLFLSLYLLKKQNKFLIRLLDFVLSILPKKISLKLEEMLDSFLEGIGAFEKKRDYVTIFVYSILIWACYWVTLHITFYAFNLFELYQVNAVSSLVLLVIVTVSVVIPSSPGYVGTYHYLCQLSLALFGVPRAVGLSYAFVAHALSLLPTALLGFIYAWKEGISRMKIEEEL